MEYILKNTDIFDEKIDIKFKDIIINSKNEFDENKIYKLKVSFHVNLLSDPRFQEFNVPVRSKLSKGTEEDNIRDVMSFQLERLEDILAQNSIEARTTTIQGDYLDEENIIKIEIYEDNSRYMYDKKGKRIKGPKVSSIVPSLQYTQDTISKFASERTNELYANVMDAIVNKKIMSEILEIEETVDDEKLFKAFADKYGGLWLTNNEREKELLNKLEERCLFVLNKHIAEQKKKNNIILN